MNQIFHGDGWSVVAVSAVSVSSATVSSSAFGVFWSEGVYPECLS